MSWVPAIMSGLQLAQSLKAPAAPAPTMPKGSGSAAGPGDSLGAMLAGISGGANTQVGGPGAVTIPAQAFQMGGKVKKPPGRFDGALDSEVQKNKPLGNKPDATITITPGGSVIARDADGRPGVPVVAKPGEVVIPAKGADEGAVIPAAGDPTAPQALPPPAVQVPPTQGTPATTPPPATSGLKWSDALKVLAEVAKTSMARQPHAAPGVNLSRMGQAQTHQPFASAAPQPYMPQQGPGLGALLMGR